MRFTVQGVQHLRKRCQNICLYISAKQCNGYAARKVIVFDTAAGLAGLKAESAMKKKENPDSVPVLSGDVSETFIGESVAGSEFVLHLEKL